MVFMEGTETEKLLQLHYMTVMSQITVKSTVFQP